MFFAETAGGWIQRSGHSVPVSEERRAFSSIPLSDYPFELQSELCSFSLRARLISFPGHWKQGLGDSSEMTVLRVKNVGWTTFRDKVDENRTLCRRTLSRRQNIEGHLSSIHGVGMKLFIYWISVFTWRVTLSLRYTDRHLSFRDLKYILGLFNVSTVGYNKRKYKDILMIIVYFYQSRLNMTKKGVYK